MEGGGRLRHFRRPRYLQKIPDAAAHYRDELSRNRFMLILAAPFLVLSVVPLILCTALSIAPPLWLH